MPLLDDAEQIDRVYELLKDKFNTSIPGLNDPNTRKFSSIAEIVEACHEVATIARNKTLIKAHQIANLQSESEVILPVFKNSVGVLKLSIIRVAQNYSIQVLFQ